MSRRDGASGLKAKTKGEKRRLRKSAQAAAVKRGGGPPRDPRPERTLR